MAATPPKSKPATKKRARFSAESDGDYDESPGRVGLDTSKYWATRRYYSKQQNRSLLVIVIGGLVVSFCADWLVLHLSWCLPFM